MAKKVSTKRPLTGNRRSHALNATKHAQKPNFQKVTIDGEKVVLSAREARTLKKEERNS
jgi:ribosomal protein L28